nr:MAG TPA: hypothetical protein [Caudoviricetes sp.]
MKTCKSETDILMDSDNNQKRMNSPIIHKSKMRNSLMIK